MGPHRQLLVCCLLVSAALCECRMLGSAHRSGRALSATSGPAFAAISSSCHRNLNLAIFYPYDGDDWRSRCLLTSTTEVDGSTVDICAEWYVTQPGSSLSYGSYDTEYALGYVTFLQGAPIDGELVFDGSARLVNPMPTTTCLSTVDESSCKCGDANCLTMYQVNPASAIEVTCDSAGGSNTGAIVGGVLGAIAAVAVLAGLAFFVIRQRRRRQAHVAGDTNFKGYPAPAPGGTAMPPPAGGGSGSSYYGSTKGGAGVPPSYPPSTAPLASGPLGSGIAAGLASQASHSTVKSSGGPMVDTLIPHSSASLTLATVESNPPPGTPTARSAGDPGALPGCSTSGTVTEAALSKDEYLSKIVSLAPSAGSVKSPVGGVDARHWVFDFRDLQVLRPIGEGSFGKVYVGLWHSTKVACKVLVDKGIVQQQSDGGAGGALVVPAHMMAQLDAEAGMLAQLRHPNVLNFLGICYSPPCILTEYCPMGSLHEVLARGRSEPAIQAQLSWHRLLGMALDAALGMLYLHTRPTPILHRDFKSPNLFIEESWRVKVGDFNLSRILQEDGTKSTSMAAMNPRWLAPELIRGAKATRASDVFAFGVVMWELLTWRLPWGDVVNGWQLVKDLQEGARLAVPPRETLPCPDKPDGQSYVAFVELMQGCWEEVEAARPGFADIAAELRRAGGEGAGVVMCWQQLGGPPNRWRTGGCLWYWGIGALDWRGDMLSCFKTCPACRSIQEQGKIGAPAD